jgi:ribosomal-protein-alanine N-acetyltransferase
LRRLFAAEVEPPPPTEELLLGYVGLWFLGDEAHITSIAVREAYRRRGIGQLLLITTMEAAIERNCRVVTLEARVSNDPAITLYERYGFRRMGIRRGYYTDNREDAVVMSTDPLSSDEFQTSFLALKASLHARLAGVPAES